MASLRKVVSLHILHPNPVTVKPLSLLCILMSEALVSLHVSVTYVDLCSAYSFLKLDTNLVKSSLVANRTDTLLSL